MLIALDYDGTFTEDPDAWCAIVAMLQSRGHSVYGVTMRYEHESEGLKRFLDVCDEVFFTGRKAKQRVMLEAGVFISVWIDDSPAWILNDAR